MPKVATPLTDTQIKKAKPQDKEHALYDGNGLRMIIPSKKSNKRKYFRFDYTRPNGKRNSLSLGIYPETSLAEARKMVQEYRGLLKKGIDPAQTRKEDKNSVDYKFSKIADEFLQKKKNEIASSTLENYFRYVKYMNQTFGEKNINDIAISDITTLLLSFNKDGKSETAHRILKLLKQIYKYAISKGLSKHNTANDIDAKNLLTKRKPKHYAHITNEKELAKLLLDIERYSGHPIVMLGLKFISMTFVRPQNVRFLKWEQVNLQKKLIIYDEEDMKKGNRHIIPITSQIEILLNQAEQYRKNEYIFPSPMHGHDTLSENTLNDALKRMGYKNVMTSHGFRHTASTILHENISEHGIHSDGIEMQLAHILEGNSKTKQIYNHAEYIDERRKLMKWWCEYLDILKKRYKS